MAINKVRDLNGDGDYGVSLPNDDLREAGILDEQGNLREENRAVVVRFTGTGWSVEPAAEHLQPASR